ncbi:MAG: FadR family transcriptional regulator [Burkholderiaceae bacterium]|nr:FadR family transcriptional regulator [Burkholderiaceae bacterium]
MTRQLAAGRPRNLAQHLVDQLGQRIRDGLCVPGERLPTESALVAEFGVSRTVVREALSKLQAAGLVTTRHGVGTFVAEEGEAERWNFRIQPHERSTLADVIALLELRIGVESEAAALAALRRTPDNLAAMRTALDDFAAAVDEHRDAVNADYQFHAEIARASQNAHFAALMASFGTRVIPRARLAGDMPDAARQAFLRRVNLEHESILDAITAQDPDSARAAMRTHLVNSRERRRRAAEAGETLA